jgi:hypothetical protein
MSCPYFLAVKRFERTYLRAGVYKSSIYLELVQARLDWVTLGEL